jgi:N,N'-diacetylchitobiose transport system permease protein
LRLGAPQVKYPVIVAASALMTLPVLVYFLLVRRRLVSGLGGAVKD